MSILTPLHHRTASKGRWPKTACWIPRSCRVSNHSSLCSTPSFRSRLPPIRLTTGKSRIRIWVTSASTKVASPRYRPITWIICPTFRGCPPLSTSLIPSGWCRRDRRKSKSIMVSQRPTPLTSHLSQSLTFWRSSNAWELGRNLLLTANGKDLSIELWLSMWQLPSTIMSSHLGLRHYFLSSNSESFQRGNDNW